MHMYIAWDKVDNPSPQITPQILPSFEEYTPPVTYPEQVEETLGTPMEVTFHKEIPGSRKAYLLEDKQIPSVGVFIALGQHLEEIQMTWTKFGKKRDKITTLHEEAQKVHTVSGDGIAISSDGVKMLKQRRQKKLVTASGPTDSKKP
ncbi:hypothetical protein Tco_1114470 [Tanacetum coccineum]|uniref:Uncharacterized protein n=1 Tax=Tanacetum coccineum TaxID=301880 RepID=A0ABQ5IV71_9ASTR